MRIPNVDVQYDDDNAQLAVDKSSSGAVLNYTLNGSGSYGLDDSEFDYNGVSGIFDGWIFSRLGVAENSFSLTGGELRRLTSAYTYTDPKRLTVFTAGDFTTSALTWSRSSRLVGFQSSSAISISALI
ncbi:MAG: hypothetical protein QNJ43_17540 [Breoghania sp.]|nr:hypothetical protein [Breoghania sp.]